MWTKPWSISANTSSRIIPSNPAAGCGGCWKKASQANAMAIHTKPCLLYQTNNMTPDHPFIPPKPGSDVSYILNELGEERENYFNAIAPPIMQTSNFAFKKVEDLRRAFADEMSGYLYSRGLNPTVDILRKKLAALDG